MAVYADEMPRTTGDMLLEFTPVRSRSRIRIARGALGGLGKFVRETTEARQVVL